MHLPSRFTNHDQSYKILACDLCLSSTKVTGILTLSQTSLQYKSFENTVEKGEIARKEQFLLFPQCFLPFWISSRHLHKIQNCHLQTFQF